MELHIVIASNGEYSDRTEWPIKAFRTEAAAEGFVNQLDAVLKANPPRPTCGNWQNPEVYEKFQAEVAAWFSKLQADFAAAGFTSFQSWHDEISFFVEGPVELVDE